MPIKFKVSRGKIIECSGLNSDKCSKCGHHKSTCNLPDEPEKVQFS